MLNQGKLEQLQKICSKHGHSLHPSVAEEFIKNVVASIPTAARDSYPSDDLDCALAYIGIYYKYADGWKNISDAGVSHRRNIKDSVFCDYFADPDRFMDAYCAITGKTFAEGVEVESNVIAPVFTNGVRNDVSFRIGDRLIVLVEHQSTVNYNMPVRCLVYVSELYNRYTQGDNLYRTALIPLPEPEFIVLYNGDREFPDKTTMKLSDAFLGSITPQLELTVNMYNINNGRNLHIMQKSRHLDDYSKVIGKVCEFLAQGKTVREAVLWCIGNNIMKEYLEAHLWEVCDMLNAEFNLEKAKEVWIGDSWKEGREEGIKESVIKMLKSGVPTYNISEWLQLPIEKVQELQRTLIS
jgi:hypothetical protein